MTAITLGYHTHGRTAEPVALYVGCDAGAARGIFQSPPDGIVRTELILHPRITRRRVTGTAAPVADEPVPAEAEKPAPAPKAEKAEKAKPLSLPSKTSAANTAETES